MDKKFLENITLLFNLNVAFNLNVHSPTTSLGTPWLYWVWPALAFRTILIFHGIDSKKALKH